MPDFKMSSTIIIIHPLFLLTTLTLIAFSTPFAFDASKFTAINHEEAKTVRNITFSKLGNVSNENFELILSSLRTMEELAESPKFPRLKVFNYNFGGEDGIKQVLVYMDPDEGKQWIVNIENVDLRSNVIVFHLGDLGFGFRKEDTFVVLRKSEVDKSDIFHYINLAYIYPDPHVKGGKRVEWDIVKPRDILPIPLLFNEPVDSPSTKCSPRPCSIKEWIFGICPIIQLSCANISELVLNAHDKERIDTLIKDKQPFVYELAQSLSINGVYIDHVLQNLATYKKLTSERRRRSIRGGSEEQNNMGAKREAKIDGFEKVDEESGKEEFEEQIGSGEVQAAMSSYPKDNDQGLGEVKEVPVYGTFSFDEAPAQILEHEAENLAEPKALDSQEVSVLKPRIPREDADGALESAEPVPVQPIDPDTKRTDAVAQAEELKVEADPIPSSSSPPEASEVKTTTMSSVVADDIPEEVPGAVSADNNLNTTEFDMPSAFDLILMKNEDPNAVEIKPVPTPVPKHLSYFDSIVNITRSSPSFKYIGKPFECIGCERLGTFFAEYEEDPQVSPVVHFMMVDIFKNAPVDQMFSPGGQEMLQEHHRVPYLGYGACDSSADVLRKPPKSMELDDIIDFYGESLGVNCEKKDCESQLARTRMRELLTSKHHLLQVSPDMSIRFNRSSQLAKRHILSSNEFRQLMISLILSVYTVEYRWEALGHVNSDYPPAPNIYQSLRMKFITRVILGVMDELRKHLPHHLIKGSRYLLQILQDKFLSLVVELFGIRYFDFKGNERERLVYERMNKKDRMQVLALKDFIINGLAALIRDGTEIRSAFKTMFEDNGRRIMNELRVYVCDPSDKTRPPRSNEAGLDDFDLFEETTSTSKNRVSGGAPASTPDHHHKAEASISIKHSSIVETEIKGMVKLNSEVLE